MMNQKRRVVVRNRKMIFNGIEYSVPRYVRRDMKNSAWLLVVGGIRRSFPDAAFESTRAALEQAVYHLGMTFSCILDYHAKNAPITISIKPHADTFIVVGKFMTGKNGWHHAPEVYVAEAPEGLKGGSFPLNKLPLELQELDYVPLLAAWVVAFGKSTAHAMLDDDVRASFSKVRYAFPKPLPNSQRELAF